MGTNCIALFGMNKNWLPVSYWYIYTQHPLNMCDQIVGVMWCSPGKIVGSCCDGGL